MPRKNDRDEPQPLLDLTSPREDLTKALRPAPISRRGRVTQTESDLLNAKRKVEAAQRQLDAAIRNGIDWSVCIIPGCGEEPPKYLDPRLHGDDQHNPDVWLPVCGTHGATIWRTMNQIWKDPAIQAEMLNANDRYDQAVERTRKVRVLGESDGPGHIYFLRQNGLIKAGWAQYLEPRLKNYGPDVELLVHYEGSRQDETELHRQLRPSLAKGREWYHDNDVLAHFISEAIRRHGPPKAQAYWTQPKSPEVRQRRRR